MTKSESTFLDFDELWRFVAVVHSSFEMFTQTYYQLSLEEFLLLETADRLQILGVYTLYNSGWSCHEIASFLSV